MLRLLATVKMW